MPKGKLYLIPTPLGENAVASLPAYVIERLHQLDYFIAERARTARRFIKSTAPKRAISELTVFELDKHEAEAKQAAFLAPLKEGHDMGLLSEAGCPGVADPGAQIVRLAHEQQIQVVPLVGPSSILLALMASGMSGQSFCFHGYLPPKKPDLAKELKRLEQLAKRQQQTQLFIETPYRNEALIEEALKCLNGQTRFGIAADLTLPTEYIANCSIHQWQKRKRPNLHKRPAIFMIY